MQWSSISLLWETTYVPLFMIISALLNMVNKLTLASHGTHNYMDVHLMHLPLYILTFNEWCIFCFCRYASVFPHFQLLFSSILEKYGKKQDIVSATKAFEIFKKKSGGLNMFAWRAMIDLCGHCGDFLKSRSIFEVLIHLFHNLNLSSC